MKADFQAWSRQVARLDRALKTLTASASATGLAPPDGEEWYDLLRLKLAPQLAESPLLVVAVVGGTNIGKSAIFNQLVGETASQVSPLAAGTKHPVLLVSEDADEPERLSRLFEGFELKAWNSAENPLEESETDWLFWRRGQGVPPKLLVLDTPDIDSDAKVNWRRADRVRQAADVLIAVLTQQKYNDAAVKEFFRKAAQADKSVVIVFNQVDLAADREFWPKWLATFADETGAKPLAVLVAPHDRQGANQLGLRFYSVGVAGQDPTGEPVSLARELAEYRFDELKLRALRGAAGQVLDSARGANAYLDHLEAWGRRYQQTERSLSAAEMTRVRLPSLPSSVLIDEIRAWWDAHRGAWSKRVHGAYRAVGRVVTWPVRKTWRAWRPSESDPLESFHAREGEAIVEAVEILFDQLERLAKIGDEILRPRVEKLLAGGSRKSLLTRVRDAHRSLPAIDETYRTFLHQELDRLTRENPRATTILRSLDAFAALARPAITLTLAFSGLIVAGDVVGQTAAHVAGHTVTNLAAEAAIAGGIAGGGEVAVSATGEGIKQAAAIFFTRLHDRYKEERAHWLVEWLNREFLGDLYTDLRRGAAIASDPALREARAALHEWRLARDVT